MPTNTYYICILNYKQKCLNVLKYPGMAKELYFFKWIYSCLYAIANHKYVNFRLHGPSSEFYYTHA